MQNSEPRRLRFSTLTKLVLGLWALVVLCGISTYFYFLSRTPQIEVIEVSTVVTRIVEVEITAEPEPTAETPLATETPSATPSPTQDASPSVTPSPTQPPLVFYSTSLTTADDYAQFDSLVAPLGHRIIPAEASEAINQLDSDSKSIDILHTLHTLQPYIAESVDLLDLTEATSQLSADRDFSPSLIEASYFGESQAQQFIPWMHSSYLFVTRNEALAYLPEDSDIQNLSWEELAAWCQNILDQTSQPRCGIPLSGSYHRLIQGYLYPSFTGSGATAFRANDAVTMYAFIRDDLWPAIHPNSAEYEHMSEPLKSGEVWIAFDHTSRLIDAIDDEPDQYTAIPAPIGPAGRGFTTILFTLMVPSDSTQTDRALEIINHLTHPEQQARILDDLGYFPVLTNVNIDDLPASLTVLQEGVTLQISDPNGIAAVIPAGLGSNNSAYNDVYRSAFERIVINGEEPKLVLAEESENLQALIDDSGAVCWAPDQITDEVCRVADPVANP